MKRTLVRYKVKPEQVQENARLIELVFQELQAKSPEGVRYLALRLDDGTFVHFATVETQTAPIRYRGWRLFGPSKAASKSVASSCRRRAMRPSSATIGCLAKHRRGRIGRWAIETHECIRPGTAEARAAFDRLLGELRPKLHRYCARMTGSVIDGEDVVQEALVKAIEALPASGIDRSSGGLAVSHRPQCGAGLSAPPRPTGGRPLRRGSGHDRRPRKHRGRPSDRRRQPAHLHAAAGRAAQLRHPHGRARLLAAGDRRRDRTAAFRPSRPRCIAAAPACASWRRSPTTSAARPGRTPALASRRLCRALQRPRFRRHTRHARRRGAPRTRRQEPYERAQRGRRDISQLLARARIGIWCRDSSTDARRFWCAIPAMPRERRRISCCWIGLATGSSASAIFVTRATQPTARSC